MGKAISSAFSSSSSYLYCLILLLAFIYSFRQKKLLVLIGLGMGCLFGLLLLIRLPFASYKEMTGLVLEAKKNYFILLSKGRRYYVYLKEHDFYFGDIVTLQGYVGELSITKYEGYFSFEKYLNDKGVFYSFESAKVINSFSLLNIRKIEKAFLSNFNEETASLIDAVLFSFKDSKDGTLSLSISLGIYSQLSNGGVILYSYLRIFDPILNRKVDKERNKNVIRLFLILPFLILGIGKLGIWKIFLVNLSYIFLNKEKLSYGHRLVSIAFLMVIFDRWSILSSAFFYSFGLSFLFLLCGRMLNKGRNDKIKKLKRRALLEAFLLPSSIENGKIAFFSPLYRIIGLPFVLPFILLSLISFVTFPFTNLLTFYSQAIRKVLIWFSYAELSVPFLGNNSETVVILLYLVLLISLFFYDTGLHLFGNKTLKITAFCLILNVLPISNLLTREVTFINVGQGDALLIRDGLKTVMIDTGGAKSLDIGNEVDIPYLYKKRIYHLDYLITTHDDFDHSGGVSSLLKNFDVRHYINSKDSFPLDIGGIHLENLNIYDGEGNESSLVLYMDFIGKKFLFMGDAGISVEKKIINDHPDLKVDILKVGHHGSNTSTSEAFIRTIRPKEAIISVGENNMYGHPSNDVLDTLSLYDVKIRRTDEEGSITYWGTI